MTIGVVLARPLELAESEPASAITEQDLMRSGRLAVHGPMRRESCVCGGVIKAATDSDEQVVARVVRLHNRSTIHAQAMVELGYREGA